jgi:hypothetical protein
MDSTPSIKGTVFESVVESVRSVVNSGRIAADDLTRWLKPGDLDFLDEEILLVGWYDIGVYARMNALLRDVEGGGSNEYLRECGRRTARGLLEAGLYPQLEYLHRTKLAGESERKARFEAFGHDLQILTSISSGILNFSRWTAKPDPERSDRYLIEVSDAKDFPEELAWRSDGFVNEMASQHGEPDLWGWGRTAPDLIVFRMLRAL